MSETTAPVSSKASGSEKRQRGHIGAGRFDDAEYSLLLEKSQTVGLTVSGYIRALVIGTAGPRARRTPPVNAEVLARATAALNKAGSNLNQIARVLNAGGAIATAHECFAALAETRAAAPAIREIVGRKNRP
jgi:hypothetical protein